MKRVLQAAPIRLSVAMVCVAAGGCDRYPPALPLDPEFTHCRSVDECVVIELGCEKSCFGGLAVSVRRDQADRVDDQYSERCGKNHDYTMGLCPPWEATCDAGTCGMHDAEPTYE